MVAASVGFYRLYLRTLAEYGTAIGRRVERSPGVRKCRRGRRWTFGDTRGCGATRRGARRGLQWVGDAGTIRRSSLLPSDRRWLSRAYAAGVDVKGSFGGNAKS